MPLPLEFYNLSRLQVLLTSLEQTNFDDELALLNLDGANEVDWEEFIDK